MALCPVLWRQGRSGRHHWGCVVLSDVAPIVHLSTYLILRSARSRYHLRCRVWLNRQLSCDRGQGWSRRPFRTERNGPYLSPPRRWVRQALLMCLISPVSLLSACSVPAQKKGCEYKFYTEFQSHEPEFDYLKSLEIEEKINKIKWCKRQNQAHFLLSTNGALSDLPRPFHNYTTTTPCRQNNQTLESLWKVASCCFWIKSSWWCPSSTSSIEPVTSTTSSDDPSRKYHCCCTPQSLRKCTCLSYTLHLCQLRSGDIHFRRRSANQSVESQYQWPKFQWACIFFYGIGKQTFLRQWFTDIVDIKPVNMEELTEVITATEFHPFHCNLFMYSSSKSSIKLADMRDSALCDKYAKCTLSLHSSRNRVLRGWCSSIGFEEEEDPTTRSFFSEIISSISDVKFSYDGRYILSRDYLSLKIWDVNMESKPIKTIPIHDHLRGKLCDLYENDCIFDKFECVWGGDDRYVIVAHILFVLCIPFCANLL